MKYFFLKNRILILIFALALLIFYPSLKVFYTNDDFFFLRISNINSPYELLNFFNILQGPEGFGMYRPLTSQVFYLLAWSLFDLNPIGLHVISFFVFFVVIYLTYKLVKELFLNTQMASIAAFLYAVSATHFAHLYYLSTFQELGMTAFVLASCVGFIKKRFKLSFFYFLLALMSKETAVVTPFVLILINWFQNQQNSKAINFKRLLVVLSPFFLTLCLYFLVRHFSYGYAIGDTYVWDFSLKKLLNTIFWYLVWSFNLPETILDFVGPGIHINPNLFRYWSKQVTPIIILFFVLVGSTILFSLKLFLKSKTNVWGHIKIFIFSSLWFLASLVPVVFLPIHKFTFFLTLPLIGVVVYISHLLTFLVNRLLVISFLFLWTVISILTINHTVNTNWITQGEKVSKRAYEFFSMKRSEINGRVVLLKDTIEDDSLPFSPTTIVKTSLSENNFFAVYFPEMSKNVYYNVTGELKDVYIVNSRKFIVLTW